MPRKKAFDNSKESLFQLKVKKADLVSKFGQGLIDARKKQRLSQEEVSFKIGQKSSSAISRWESGKAMPDLNDFVQLCKLYRKTPNQLLDIKGE